jgi:predicted transcriptional regulator
VCILRYKGGVGMSGVKHKIIQMIESLPEDVTVDDIIAELYFRLQVDAGLKELDEGKWIAHEEVEKRMSKWLTK